MKVKDARILYIAIKCQAPISTYIKENIQTAARMDDRLTATQVQQGTGLGFVPASADLAAAHVGRDRLELQKAMARSGESHELQSVFGFEAIADDIDSTDNSHSGSQETAKNIPSLADHT